MGMKNVTPDEIRTRAYQLAKVNKSWHFHILTAICKLNGKEMPAFILENNTDNETLVHYSEKPLKELGKELVQLLHGKDVIKKKNEVENKQEISPNVKKLLDRARELNNQGKLWHHHMLFPFCTFNKNKGQWTIIFEDQENATILESVSGKEPKQDLTELETLFYQQNI